MPETAETTASLAFANTVRTLANTVGNPRLAADIEANAAASNAALRAAMLTAGISAASPEVVALDAATAALGAAADAGNNPRYLQDLVGTHADAITAAAEALVAVP